MSDLILLKAKLTEKRMNYDDAAKIIEKSRQSFCDKINGKVPFTVWEMFQLGEKLGIDNSELKKIFLH